MRPLTWASRPLRCGRRSRRAALVACGLLVHVSLAAAQEETAPGHSIGEVSIQGDLIVVELHDGALGEANPFDLAGRTLSFTPVGSRYRVASGDLRWEADLGPQAATAEVTLRQFAFPFSGTAWRSFLVGANGSISFGRKDRPRPLRQNRQRTVP